MKRIALVYAKRASSPIASMDLIRWTEIGANLTRLGLEVDLLTDQPDGVATLEGLPIRDSSSVEWSRYDAVKVCYQRSIDLVPPHPNMIVRMCRVVSEQLPARDQARRPELLRQQQRVSDLATWVAVNDAENGARWRALYGDRQEVLVVPGACPESIPKPQRNPFPIGRRIVLFCGSLTSPRFPVVLNHLARALRALQPNLEVHVVGRNRLHLYGDGQTEPLDTDLVKVHPPVDQTECWQFLLHADVGLALAPSADAFEGELTKIYYYLRAGLPVVTESTALNRSLVEHTGHGVVANYGDLDGLVRAVASSLELPVRKPEVQIFMRDHHSWKERARTYLHALERGAKIRSEEAS